jgi:hypothetical protein
MTKIYLNGEEVAKAFPAAVRHDALVAWSVFPATRVLGESFSVRVLDEDLLIPYRLYNDPALIHTDSLTALQQELVSCLLTRHSDGLVREEHLERTLGVNHSWVPPFVIQLAGEYVIEILQLINRNLTVLDKALYAQFIRDNPEFLQTTAQRIASYWDCYYRNERWEDYVGFKLLAFFQYFPSVTKLPS